MFPCVQLADVVVLYDNGRMTDATPKKIAAIKVIVSKGSHVCR